MDDLERAGAVVRNIERVEADGELAIGALSERMMRASVQAITKVATAPWQVIEIDWTARVVCPEWKMVRGVGTGDAWLELTEIGAEDEEGFSWIGVAVGAAPTRFGLELAFRPGLQARAETVIHDDKVVAPLLKLGMVRDESATRLFFPVAVQAELLAQGFEQNDLDKALLPVGKATEKAIAAKSELDRLIGQVRNPATGK
ncbi:hypothetical protein ASE49_10930 [Novosphingobium sp. Leaf2]|nr:hypothetical protein ASE49_10930 [Novosphingobium sp. Leaf2]